MRVYAASDCSNSKVFAVFMITSSIISIFLVYHTACFSDNTIFFRVSVFFYGCMVYCMEKKPEISGYEGLTLMNWNGSPYHTLDFEMKPASDRRSTRLP